MNYAILGAGCFWCIEAIFSQLDGVNSVISGYSGGNVSNPTYKEICSGKTGHAEVCRIEYNPEIISFEQLLKVFWENHNPTTLNRQGNDIGTQYRSVIFYDNDKEKNLAKKYKQKLEKSKIFKDSIVTEIVKFTKFYEAEDYHQNNYENNKMQPYCKFVIKPKLDNFFENQKK